jgi:hypothetical protein
MKLKEPDSFHAETSTYMEVYGPHDKIVKLMRWMIDNEIATARGGGSSPYCHIFAVFNEDAPKVTKWLEEHGCEVSEWVK